MGRGCRGKVLHPGARLCWGIPGGWGGPLVHPDTHCSMDTASLYGHKPHWKVAWSVASGDWWPPREPQNCGHEASLVEPSSFPTELSSLKAFGLSGPTLRLLTCFFSADSRPEKALLFPAVFTAAASPKPQHVPRYVLWDLCTSPRADCPHIYPIAWVSTTCCQQAPVPHRVSEFSWLLPVDISEPIPQKRDQEKKKIVTTSQVGT